MPKLRDIIGHQLAKEELSQDLQTDNVSHAYLLSGDRHIGKFTTAHWFAHSLLTHHLEDEAKERATKQYEQLTHPDLLVLDTLWIEGKTNDWDSIAQHSNIPQQHRSKTPKAKTDVISIDDIRALQARLHETGTSPWRCCLIRSMERMQDAAASAFLKILEEPPEGLVFLLTTQSVHTLLSTVVSRARVVNMRRLSNVQMLPMLNGAPEDDVKFILHIARGAPGIAHALLEDPDLLREHKMAHTHALSLWKSTSLKERLQILQPIQERGEEADRLLLHLGMTLREHSADPVACKALSILAAGLKTNAHRQLLTQQFALSI